MGSAGLSISVFGAQVLSLQIHKTKKKPFHLWGD